MNEKFVEPFQEQGNFTMCHNLVFDYIMPRVSANAFKVLCLIIRQTKGRGQSSSEVSYSWVAKKSGIKSSATIASAFKELLDLGCIVKKDGAGQFDATRYALNRRYRIPALEIKATLEIEAEDFSATALKNEAATALKNEAATALKNEDIKRNKENKESTTSKEVVDDACAPSPPKGKPLSRKKPTGLPANHPVRLEIARCWVKDLESPATMAKEYSLIADATKRFVSLGATPDTIRAVEACWYQHEFRGQKGEPPSPPELLATYQKMTAGIYEGKQNGQSHHGQSEHKSVTNLKRSLIYG